MEESLMRKNVSENPFFFIGLTIGLVISIILWVIGEDRVSTISLGISITIMGLVIEVLLQLKEQEHQTAHLLNLEKTIGRDQWLYTKLIQITHDYCKTKELAFDLLNKKAQIAIEDFSREIYNFSQGTFYGHVDQEKQEILSVVRLATASIKATSYVAPSWWNSVEGRQYFEEHKGFQKNGGCIERIFILRDSDSIQEVWDLIELQIKNGMQVRVVKSSLIPLHMREDFLIVDKKILSLTEVARDGQTKRVITSVDGWLVNKYLDYFEVMLPLSRFVTNVEELKNISH